MSETPSNDWIRVTRHLYPSLNAALDRAGIHDSETYLQNESGLPFRIRSELARSRHDLMLIGRCEVREQALAAPPWVRSLPLSEMRVPARIRDALAPHGILRLCDLDQISDADLMRLGPLTRSGLRTLSLAVLAVCRSDPPRRTHPEPGPDRIQELIGSAPEEVLRVRIRDLVGLRPRPVSSLIQAGVGLLSDLSNLTERDILGLPGFGRGNLDALIRAIETEIMRDAHAEDEALLDPAP